MTLLDMLKIGSSVTTVYNSIVSCFQDLFQEAAEEAKVPIPLAYLLDKEYDEERYLALAEVFSERYFMDFDYSFEEFVEAVEYFVEEVSE